MSRDLNPIFNLSIVHKNCLVIPVSQDKGFSYSIIDPSLDKTTDRPIFDSKEAAIRAGRTEVDSSYPDCPKCGSVGRGDLDDGDRLFYRCQSCDHAWYPNPANLAQG